MSGTVAATALLLEVADVLRDFGHWVCTPTVEHTRDEVVLTVRVPGGDLEVFELLQRLRYVSDIAQMRAFAVRYGIEPERLEALLPPAREESA